MSENLRREEKGRPLRQRERGPVHRDLRQRHPPQRLAVPGAKNDAGRDVHLQPRHERRGGQISLGVGTGAAVACAVSTSGSQIV